MWRTGGGWLGLAAAVCLVVGCGDQPFGTGDCVTKDFDAAPAPEYKGLTEPDARKKAAADDKSFRIVGKDGDCLGVDADLSRERVNVTIVNEVVQDAAYF